MSPSADIQAVISVFPDLERSQLVGAYLQEFRDCLIDVCCL